MNEDGVGQFDIALFLPFGRNKERQTWASADTSEGRESTDSLSDGVRSGDVRHRAAKRG